MLSVIKRSKAIKISKLLKLPKPSKLLSRLCPESLPEVPQTHLPSPNPPLIDAFQRGSPGSRGFGVEPSPALGGSPPPDHWVQQEIQMDRVGGVSVAQATLGSVRDPDGPRLRREREGLRG